MNEFFALTTSSIWLLPYYHNQTAPYYFNPERLWFEKADTVFAINCIDALISLGIGENSCPQHNDWAAFVVSGAITKALSKKSPVIPFAKPADCFWHSETHLERYLWEILHCSAQDDLKKKTGTLDKNFLAAMLKFFLPRLESDGMESEIASQFMKYWDQVQAFWGSSFGSTATLWPKYIDRGRKTFQSLPGETQGSIVTVAGHISGMLQLILPFIRRKYSY